MLMRKLLSAVTVVVFLLVVDTSDVLAQWNCGDGCTACGDWVQQYEAENDDPWGWLDKDCCYWCLDCEACKPSIDDHTPAAALIAESIQSESSMELRAVIEKHGYRLLLNKSRNLVLILGNACNPQAFESVLFVSTEKLEALERLGVRSLEDFLNDAGTPSAGTSQ